MINDPGNAAMERLDALIANTGGEMRKELEVIRLLLADHFLELRREEIASDLVLEQWRERYWNTVFNPR